MTDFTNFEVRIQCITLKVLTYFVLGTQVTCGGLYSAEQSKTPNYGFGF